MNDIHPESNLYHSVFNSAQFGLIIENSEKKIIDVNQAVCDLFGKKRSELIGIKIDDLTNKHLKQAATSLKSLTKDNNTPRKREWLFTYIFGNYTTDQYSQSTREKRGRL